MSEPALDDNPASLGLLLPSASRPPSRPREASFPKQYVREEIVTPETIKIGRVQVLPQDSKHNIHGPGSQRSGERENDLQKAAPEGNDEVDELLREWTTCFS